MKGCIWLFVFLVAWAAMGELMGGMEVALAAMVMAVIVFCALAYIIESARQASRREREADREAARIARRAEERARNAEKARAEQAEREDAERGYRDGFADGRHDAQGLVSKSLYNRDGSGRYRDAYAEGYRQGRFADPEEA